MKRSTVINCLLLLNILYCIVLFLLWGKYFNISHSLSTGIVVNGLKFQVPVIYPAAWLLWAFEEKKDDWKFIAFLVLFMVYSFFYILFYIAFHSGFGILS